MSGQRWSPGPALSRPWTKGPVRKSQWGRRGLIRTRSPGADRNAGCLRLADRVGGVYLKPAVFRVPSTCVRVNLQVARLFSGTGPVLIWAFIVHDTS